MADDASGDDRDGDESPDRAAPLGDLADRVRDRRSGGEARPEEPAFDDEEGFGLEEFFQEESFEAIESDDLWASIDTETPFSEQIDPGDAPNEHIVPKRQYCESCEHFSEPPEVFCTHPGTTIVEFEDIDHVRVRNCPVVAERQALGEADDAPMTPGTFGSQ